MRLISARQAWGDAYHENRDSVLAVAAEKAKLGKRGRVANETHADRKDTNGRTAHMLAAGLVMMPSVRCPSRCSTLATRSIRRWPPVTTWRSPMAWSGSAPG